MKSGPPLAATRTGLEQQTSSLAVRHRGVMFPVMVILSGVLLLTGRLVHGLGLHKTWPLFLIVLGVLKLLDVMRPPRPPVGPRI